MQFLSKIYTQLKNLKYRCFSQKIAFLCALSLFFAYFEMILPRFSPFFKLGLTNIVILFALDYNLLSFLALLFFKTISTCIFSGTLFSPFFIISITQSLFSGILMFSINKLNNLFHKKLVSIYGISISGSASSNFIQIWLSSLFIGKSVFTLIGPMLIFSIFSGFLTAFLSTFFKISDNIKTLKIYKNEQIFQKKSKKSVFFMFLGVFFAIISFFLHNLYFLIIIMIFSFILQISFSRKIKIIPHISIWFFVIFFSIFTPNGKVLFSLGNFSITTGAILDGIIKSLKLSIAASVSQSVSTFNLPFSNSSFFSMVMTFFSEIQRNFESTEGNLFQRAIKTISSL